MEMQDAIKLWKKKKISHAEFSFSCGNESMDDTDLTFYKEGKEVKSKELSDYFEDAIYDNVEFYDTSDGYYIGESGKVTIELNEDEDYKIKVVCDSQILRWGRRGLQKRLYSYRRNGKND